MDWVQSENYIELISKILDNPFILFDLKGFYDEKLFFDMLLWCKQALENDMSFFMNLKGPQEKELKEV